MLLAIRLIWEDYGRFATKNLDLSGEVKLYITYKLSGSTTKKFQMDIDKTGTSGMGGILNEAGGDSPTIFATKTFTITTGTASSYIHFRTESSHTIVIDEIKITKADLGTNTSTPKMDGVTFNGKTIYNKKRTALNIFDISGRFVVNSNQDIDMSSYANGFYLVKSDSNTMKICVK
ncbi:MAG: hypothetical protein QM751_07360 [Paludibacteraceae bacterium]